MNNAGDHTTNDNDDNNDTTANDDNSDIDEINEDPNTDNDSDSSTTGNSEESDVENSGHSDLSDFDVEGEDIRSSTPQNNQRSRDFTLPPDASGLNLDESMPADYNHIAVRFLNHLGREGNSKYLT